MSEDRSQVRDRALQTLDAIRQALNDDNIQAAVREIDTLQGQLVDWKRADAREWLDKALNADLMLFNIDSARGRIQQWTGTLSGESDDLLDEYRQRVERRAQEKQLALQARGVVAHCHELWRQAYELEAGDNPPHPDRLLTEYYEVAHEVARSAVVEYPDNQTLVELDEQAARILDEKRITRDIYPSVLEQDDYALALDQLAKLTVIDFVPRFRHVKSDEGARKLKFAGMVTVSAAGDEIDVMGRAWADERVAPLLQAVHDHIVGYRPQAALDALSGRKSIERFAEAPISQKIKEFEERAQDDLRRLNHAERRAQQALHLLDTNVLGAWDVLNEAQNVYPGAPSVIQSREAILGRMIDDLESRITRAEEAFNERLMERIGGIYQSARVDYSDKAPELEERLSRLEEIDWQARTFTEYRHTAMGMLDELREMVVEDVSAAADMLARLEEYPAIVLEDLPGLTEVRAAIRRRLNMEMLYSRLYKLLHSDSIEDVENGIVEAGQFDEDRFRQLAHDLETHLTYLNGHVEYALGQNRQALALFTQVARHENHPDQAEAERLVYEIEVMLRPPVTPPVDVVDDDADDDLDDVDDLM